jgi:hypothetical protein
MFWTLELEERLHTHRTLKTVPERPIEKSPISRNFAEPSDGLEPSTSSLPSSDEREARASAGHVDQRIPEAGGIG